MLSSLSPADFLYSQWITMQKYSSSRRVFPQQRFTCILSRICARQGFPQRNASCTSKLVTPHQSCLYDLPYLYIPRALRICFSSEVVRESPKHTIGTFI